MLTSTSSFTLLLKRWILPDGRGSGAIRRRSAETLWPTIPPRERRHFLPPLQLRLPDLLTDLDDLDDCSPGVVERRDPASADPTPSVSARATPKRTVRRGPLRSIDREQLLYPR